MPSHAIQDKSIETLTSAACRCTCLSGLFKPTLSRMSLLASSCTYSLLADPDKWISFWAAVVACIPSESATRCRRYCCTCGCCKALQALTLPLSPSAYPATVAACLMVHAFATSVSTKATCLSVKLLLFWVMLALLADHFKLVQIAMSRC